MSSKADEFLGVATLVLGGVIGVFGTIAGVASCSSKAEKDKIEKIEADLNAQRAQLVQTIERSCDLTNFELSSVELSGLGDDYLLKVFGSTSVDDVIDNSQYKNVYYMLGQTEAKNILNALESLKDAKGLNDFNSPEHSMVIVGADGEREHTESSKGLAKTASACSEVYSALENAVNNAYSHYIEDVAQAHQMNGSISAAYSTVNTGEGGLEQKNSPFVSQQGIMTTSISGVVRDEEKNESYFFIDTLQGRTEGDKKILDSCRAMVTVEGANLSQAEVYAKFISGDYKKFSEVIREKCGEKVGVANGELQNNVEEIEFL